MSRRPRRERQPFVQRDGKYGVDRAGRWSSPWVLRIVVAVAVVIVAIALVYAAAHGILFSLPSR